MFESGGGRLALDTKDSFPDSRDLLDGRGAGKDGKEGKDESMRTSLDRYEFPRDRLLGMVRAAARGMEGRGSPEFREPRYREARQPSRERDRYYSPGQWHRY
jgi:hypothetical protein